MNPQIHPDLRRAFDVVEQFRSATEKLNAGPHTTPAEAPGESTSTKRVLTPDTMLEMRHQLRKLSTPELYHAFSLQAAREDTGVPLSAWLAAGPAGLDAQLAINPNMRRALDTSSGSALVRQDLEPIMYELFVRVFPAFDRIAKEPANGLVHTYTQQTGFGGAEHMSELGTVTDDRGTYVRATTPIAITATRRGVTLKQQYAALQSGSGFNPEQLEMRSALLAVSSRLQQDIFHGNANPTESAGTDADEAGLYDPDGFTGLRQILNTARAKDVNPFASTPEDMRAAWDRACVEIMDAGGMASLIYARATDKTTFDLQQDKNVRYDRDLTEVAVGVMTNSVNTVFGPLPIVAVPGASIGTYEYSSWGADNAADTYILDEGTISLPYLGASGPQIIEIPMGVGGQLTRQFIVFGMWGLAVKALQFSNKVRVKQS